MAKNTTTTTSKPKHPGGRPSKYPTINLEQVKKLAAAGWTDAQMYDFFGVHQTTWDEYKRQHPEFIAAIKDSKAIADAEVERSLFERAKGYSHPAVKILQDRVSGDVIEAPYTEYYPPDTTACIFWLKNRQPAQWRDKQEVEHSGSVALEELIAARRGEAKE